MTLLLDAGALIALGRHDRAMWRTFVNARRDGIALISHGGIIGQVWRAGGPKQARLASVLRGIAIRPLDEALGRAAGALLARTRGADVIDAALVALARDGDVLMTSDTDDIARLADASGRELEIVRV